MSDPALAPLTLDGWYTLHQFYRIHPGRIRDEADDGPLGWARALARRFGEWEDLGEDGWSGLYRLVGGGNDFMAIHFRPTLDALGDVERAMRIGAEAGDLALTGDYVSVVELGLYALTAALLERAEEEGVQAGSDLWSQMVQEALEQERSKAYVQSRLRPRQPGDMPHVCFYPMDKRRSPGQNWYALPLAERARLMQDHGRTGRRYAGRISQVIHGSVGLDDWEWAVTLFAGDPLDFKNIVTEMRYDEVSAVYAEFGSFWVGRRLPAERIAAELAPEEG